MGLQIEDGTGKGYLASVNDNNQLRVSAVTSTIEHYANHNQGRAYNLNFSVTPTSAGCCFLYMKNTDSEREISIEGVYIMTEADDYIDFKFDDVGTPSNGTVITPVNLNTRSGNVAIGSFQSGNQIKSLSGSVLVQRLYHANSAASVYTNFEQDIVLDTNGVLTAYIGTGGSFLYGTVVFNYHPARN